MQKETFSRCSGHGAHDLLAPHEDASGSIIRWTTQLSLSPSLIGVHLPSRHEGIVRGKAFRPFAVSHACPTFTSIFVPAPLDFCPRVEQRRGPDAAFVDEPLGETDHRLPQELHQRNRADETIFWVRECFFFRSCTRQVGGPGGIAPPHPPDLMPPHRLIVFIAQLTPLLLRSEPNSVHFGRTNDTQPYLPLRDR